MGSNLTNGSRPASHHLGPLSEEDFSFHVVVENSEKSEQHVCKIPERALRRYTSPSNLMRHGISVLQGVETHRSHTCDANRVVFPRFRTLE